MPKQKKVSVRSVEERDQIVRENLRLRGLAVGVMVRLGAKHIEIRQEEAVQEAILPLIRAAELWEPSLGTFSTYAVACIKNYLSRSITFQPVVPLPARYRSDIKRYEKELGHSLRKCVPLPEKDYSSGSFYGEDSSECSLPWKEESLHPGRVKLDQLFDENFHRTVLRLPFIFRQVYELRFLDGLDNDQTAEKLGLKVSTVRGRVNEIYYRLRVAVGVIPPDVVRCRQKRKTISVPSS